MHGFGVISGEIETDVVFDVMRLQNGQTAYPVHSIYLFKLKKLVKNKIPAQLLLTHTHTHKHTVAVLGAGLFAD